MKRNTFILSLIMLLFCLTDLHSQILAVKSDLLTGMLSSPNFGVEVKLSNRLTLEAEFHYNPFPAGGDKRWKHWFVQPELRYWMCQPFGGHFLWGLEYHTATTLFSPPAGVSRQASA